MVEIDDLQLSLVGGGGRVNILRGIDLYRRGRRDAEHRRHLGGGQDHPADGRLRAGAGHLRQHPRRRGRPRRPRRGRAGALSPPPRRNRLPVLPPGADHDRPGERRPAPGVRRRARRCRTGGRGPGDGRPRAGGCATTPASSPAASSSASPWRGPSSPAPRCFSPTSRPATSTARPGRG